MSVITITEIGEPVKQGKFFYIPLEYKDKGKDFKKKIMDFSNREVYKMMKDAKVGENYKVEVEKDNNGYWQWKTVTKVSNDSNAAGVVDRSTLRSNYETPEERARRQVLIVRQNAVTNAVTLAGATERNIETILDTAFQFEQWILREDGNNGVEESND